MPTRRRGDKKATKTPDRWQHRSASMRCATCMTYLNYRCRKRAPTMNGWPAVFPDDWCGEHKLCKETMAGMMKNH